MKICKFIHIFCVSKTFFKVRWHDVATTTDFYNFLALGTYYLDLWYCLICFGHNLEAMVKFFSRLQCKETFRNTSKCFLENRTTDSGPFWLLLNIIFIHIQCESVKKRRTILFSVHKLHLRSFYFRQENWKSFQILKSKIVLDLFDHKNLYFECRVLYLDAYYLLDVLRTVSKRLFALDKL